MAMGSGSGPGGLNADINVTPLIDVLLVLLIIFMVIVPVTPKGLDALVPQPPKNPQQQQPNDRTIVVSILSSPGGTPSYKINQDDVPKSDLRNRLDAIYATRGESERVMFIKGDPDLNFTSVAEVVDMGRGVGVDHVGLITPKIAAGQ
ncbi:MAG TPA: biopolymer transporter ExbD [Alloacidobacterium sp.]|nr:biopolymer transporter ExbD [Alloacidobacterium sp.]